MTVFYSFLPTTVHTGAPAHDGLGRAALVRRFKPLKPSHKDPIDTADPAPEPTPASSSGAAEPRIAIQVITIPARAAATSSTVLLPHEALLQHHHHPTPAGDRAPARATQPLPSCSLALRRSRISDQSRRVHYEIN
eukprot:COSAG01_NODE_39229_length_479_cov_1.021053_1_plen_136_part_01